jgi:hypothetical protein
MQYTALPDSGTTGRTRYGGYLLGRELGPLHCDRIKSHPFANLFNLVHFWPLPRAARKVSIFPVPGER